ncbi:peptidase M15 [Oceanobacillus picturae]|uniref:Peptidase M15 n=1 Tax=Oceanobacillus picturae TaxID=171693 RepID=A0A0U9HZG7_9BACI|nr:D-Ala-D-Ala carboxypeptidase family metallohydrolase [Oceanobacillus picturae]GAQ18045.1 peptidase M15 [Oceanobacillus picturae]
MIQVGSRGHEVEKFQTSAIELGFGELLGGHGADGVFGEDTEKTAIALQKWLGVKADAIPGPITYKAIDKAKKNAGNKGTRNFKISEFNSKDGGGMLKGGMSDELLLKLETLRYQCGNKPMRINSGYRTKSHNKAVGGASNSQHMYGRAADVVVVGVSPSMVYKKAVKLFSNGGVGKYNTFTHVDTRGYKARF